MRVDIDLVMDKRSSEIGDRVAMGWTQTGGLDID